MSLVTKPSRRTSTDTTVGSQQVFISFANLYRRFIQGFNRIATSLTAILKTIGSSVTSDFRVDNDEVVGGGGGGGAGAASCGNNQAGRTLERRPKGRFVARSRRSRMFPSRSPPSIQITPIIWHQQSRYRASQMLTAPSNHPSHQEVLPYFSTRSRTDPFGYASGDSIT